MSQDRVPVQIDRENYNNLKAYADAMSLSLTAVTNEAVCDWLDTVAAARLGNDFAKEDPLYLVAAI